MKIPELGHKSDMKIDQYVLHRYVLPLMNSNMFLLISGDKALIIDPIIAPEAEGLITDAGVREIMIILTHEHFDHISGVNRLRQYAEETGGNCKVYSNRSCSESIPDPNMNLSSFFRAMFITRSEEERRIAETIFDDKYGCNSDICFDDQMDVRWEGIKLHMLSTPGHSPGSICVEIYNENDSLLALVTGDSLVEGNKVITRLPGGSKEDYKRITRPYLENFGPDTLVLPGHGEISMLRDLALG